MRYKLAMIDLDGTLLKNRTKITNKNLDGIKKYKENNGEISIATGRWPLSAFKFNEIINNATNSENKYLVTLNGSLIYDMRKNEILFEKSISKDVFLELLNIQKKYNLMMWIYSKEGIENKKIYSHKIPAKWFISKFNYGKVVNYKNEDLTVYKILFGSFSHSKIDIVKKEIEEKCSSLIEIAKPSRKVLEITAHGVNKGYALDFLTQVVNISNNEVVTFGDSDNDISMFKKSGFRICLGSKNENLVNLSNVVLNKNNGVYNGFENYVLRDFSFKKNSALVLDFSKTSFTVIKEQNFIKYIYIWNYLIQKKPLVLISKYSLNDNLVSFKDIISLNDNTLIYSSDGSTVYNCKTKKIIKKTILSETQLALLSEFLLNSLNNENVSIIFNKVSGSNYFFSKNPNNFINFINGTNFDEELFTVIDSNFSKYINDKITKITSISILGIFNIPNDLNSNSFKISIRGSSITISNKIDYLDDYEKINNEYLNTDSNEYIDVAELVNSKNKVFEFIDNKLKDNFI